MKTMKHRCYRVILFALVSTRAAVFCTCWSFAIHVRGGYTTKQRVAIIQLRSYKCVNHIFQWARVDVFSEFADIIKLKISSLANTSDMVLHCGMGVHYNTNVPSCGRRNYKMTADGKRWFVYSSCHMLRWYDKKFCFFRWSFSENVLHIEACISNTQDSICSATELSWLGLAET